MEKIKMDCNWLQRRMEKIKMDCNWLQSVSSVVVDKNSKRLYYIRKEKVIYDVRCRDEDVFFFLTTVQVKVEMALQVENYNYTIELESNLSPQYKEIEKNFTEEVWFLFFLPSLYSPSPHSFCFPLTFCFPLQSFLPPFSSSSVLSSSLH